VKVVQRVNGLCRSSPACDWTSSTYRITVRRDENIPLEWKCAVKNQQFYLATCRRVEFRLQNK
jgi:hypothetical protein